MQDFKPKVVVVDPISNLTLASDDAGLKPTLMRLIDFLKKKHVTAVFTSLINDNATALAETQTGVSSLMDSWLLLSNLEANGERTRALQVIKSRGMAHSNQVREFVFSNKGIDLIDVYVADGRVLTGRSRVGAQDASSRAGAPAGRPAPKAGKKR